jgi:hypothetical protein
MTRKARTSTCARCASWYTALHDADDAQGANKHLRQVRELSDLLGQRFVLALPQNQAEQQRRERLQNALRDILDKKN